MDFQNLFDQFHDKIDILIAQNTPEGNTLWKEFLALHPADIAQFLGSIERDQTRQIFIKLPKDLKLDVFSDLTYSMKVFCLSFLNDNDRSYLLSNLPIDELTDFFDELSDEELKKYLELLHKKDRQMVISLMQFDPESAGGIMETEVITLMQDFTVEKSIQILQRLQPRKEIHKSIYVTDQDNELVGHVDIEDLVLKNPKSRILSILRKNELIVNVNEPQEEVAQKMVHYSLMIAPVVNDENIFLGIISSETLVHIIEQEAAKDVYRISALAPIKHSYFETSFFNFLFQRSSIIILLFLIQIFSSMIIKFYEATLAGFLYIFVSTITSTGGNTSNQASAIMIQGLNSGEIDESNFNRFLRREFLMAAIIAILIAIVSFIRVYIIYPQFFWPNIAISVSLGIIVMTSTMIGGIIPYILNKFDFDPALSAAPFLATLMDILGLLIYCYISQLVLG